MVDTRLRGQWLGARKFEDLSDTAWRVFTLAMMWSNEQHEDGAIPQRYLDRLHPDGPQPAAYAEIEDAKLWVRTPEGYQFNDWAKRDGLGQSTAEYVERRTKEARERMANLRASKSPTAGGVRANNDANESENDGANVGPRLKASLKEELNEENDEPPLFCPDHPRGTTDTCVGCMNARKLHERWEREETRTPIRRAPRLGDGHNHYADEYGYCPACTERVADWPGWKEPEWSAA